MKDPCRALSIPYWKSATVSVPEDMKILHGEEFCFDLLERYVDETYFRLKHDLRALRPAAVPDGYSVADASFEEFAAHINSCYDGIGVTVEELRSYSVRAVYCPRLWLAVRDDVSGEIIASGIGELDRELGEGVLDWIQVSGSYRGRGLGSYIVKELLWRMKDMAGFVTVSGRCGNPTHPEALYRSCGFTGHDVWHILRKR